VKKGRDDKEGIIGKSEIPEVYLVSSLTRMNGNCAITSILTTKDGEVVTEI
jgi:hypothetical protein